MQEVVQVVLSVCFNPRVCRAFPARPFCPFFPGSQISQFDYFLCISAAPPLASSLASSLFSSLFLSLFLSVLIAVFVFFRLTHAHHVLVCISPDCMSLGHFNASHSLRCDSGRPAFWVYHPDDDFTVASSESMGPGKVQQRARSS